MTNEKRGDKRWQLDNFLSVFDDETNKLLGHLVDITQGGMRILSDAPIDQGSTLRVWLEILSEKISLSIKVQWNNKIEYSNIYYTGCRFVDPSSEAITKIENFIDYLKTQAPVSEDFFE